MKIKYVLTGSDIKEARKKKGISQIELARKIGKSRRTIQHYEADTVSVPNDVAQDLMRCLEIKWLHVNDGFLLEWVNMNDYEAMDALRNNIIPSVKGTQWEEPIQIAADALMEKIRAEESACESCKINPVKDEVKKVVEG